MYPRLPGFCVSLMPAVLVACLISTRVEHAGRRVYPKDRKNGHALNRRRIECEDGGITTDHSDNYSISG